MQREHKKKLARHRVAAVLLSVAGGTLAPCAFSETVSRWVDENGVTHFGNPQFAPASADAVTIKPTNGMDKVTPAATSNSAARTGPATAVIRMAPKRNKKGWRSRNESIYTGRKHSANRQYRR